MLFFHGPTRKINGIPQGSVIAPTLFLIMMNQIASTFPLIPPFTFHSIFADDVVIWCRHKSLNSAARAAQRSLTSISNWCEQWRLVISASKSSCVVFTLRNQPVPRIVNPLHINNRPIPENSSHVFLGITLDSRLTYRLHSIKTQTRGHRRLNVLRALSGTKWGGDRQTLFLLYKSLIRSVLEYNSFLFTHIASSHQRCIETIQNTALRIITGAFRTTPVNSLLAETNTLPLSMRSHASLFKYFVKTKRERNHPASICFCTTPSDLRSTAYRRSPPAGVQILRLCDKYHFDFHNIQIADVPPLLPFWTYQAPIVDFLFDNPKENWHPEEILAKFCSYKGSYVDSAFFYTDGSKSSDGVGAAFYGSSQKAFRLPHYASIFSAELFAILQVVKHIVEEIIMSAVVCSDSKSSLLALQN